MKIINWAISAVRPLVTKASLRSVLTVVGFIAISYGTYCMYVPAGIIAAGASCFVMEYLLRDEEGDSE